MGGNNLREPRMEIERTLHRAEALIHLLSLGAGLVIVTLGLYLLGLAARVPLVSTWFFGTGLAVGLIILGGLVCEQSFCGLATFLRHRGQ